MANAAARVWNNTRKIRPVEAIQISPPKGERPKESWWLDGEHFYDRRRVEQARMETSRYGQAQGSLSTAGVEARAIKRKHSIFGGFMEEPLYRFGQE